MMCALRFVLVLAALVLAKVAAAEDRPAPCPGFEVVGKGPDLVLVPGLASSPQVWDGVKDTLAKDYRLHLVHIAGFAGRAPAGDPANLLANARAEIIRHLDCQGVTSAAYAGHSLGGFLGLTLAAQHPDRIARVVVVDSLPFFPLIFDPAATPERAAPQADAMRAAVLAQDDAGFAAGQRMGVQSLVRDPAYHEQVAAWSLASDRASFAGAMHALMTTDMRPQLGTIRQPVTVMLAANPFAPRERVEPLYRAAYQGLAGVQFRVIEGSYHFIMFDQPEAFTTGLLGALQDK
ncbi:MAG: alpha/beta fold hydrolase [Erythrobacter sp.]